MNLRKKGDNLASSGEKVANELSKLLDDIYPPYY